MTIEEIFRRIVRAHLAVILLCSALPVGVVLAMNVGRPADHVAQVRLQVTSAAPVSSTEAEALSSRVLALATTPSLVRDALEAQGLDGDAEQLAAEHVTAERLGESPVVQLAVRQEEPGRAAAIVTALAHEVVQFMNQGNRRRHVMLLADTDRRLAAALAERRSLGSELDRSTSPQAREGIRFELEGVQQAIGQLSQQRLSLLLADADRDHVVLVNGDDPDVEVVASALVPRTALGLLLGLVLGLSLAVLVETLRPRVAGVRAAARSLDAPVLGKMTDPVTELTNSMTVAARRQGVETVVLVGLDDRDEKAARRLLGQIPRAWLSTGSGSVEMSRELATIEEGASGGGGPSSTSGSPPSPGFDAAPQVRFTTMYGVTPSEEPTAGLVVVTGGTVLQRQMESFDDLRRALRWPVVGIVEISHRGRQGGKR